MIAILGVAPELFGQFETSSIIALSGTPLGALLPPGPPMPTSRDNLMVVGVRGLYGWRDLGQPPGRLTTYGLGADLQFQGRSMLSAVFGYQQSDESGCLGVESCSDHRVMGELKFSGSLVTTRPFLPIPFFTENSATGNAGFELAAGYGSEAFGDRSHWTADVAVPLSLSVGQKFRVVPFAVPTLAFIWGTSSREWSRDTRILFSGGLGLQEIGQVIGLSGIDLTFSVQRAFSPGGTAFGFTVGYVRVP